MTVLVTGATGSVGRHVVDHLRTAGVPVRALSRSATTARAALPAGVEVVEGDLTEPDTLAAAAEGATAMYLFPVPEAAAGCVEVARRAGVRRIVVLSSTSVYEGEDNPSGMHHLTVERAVASTDVEWTFVRPDEFASNVLWKWGHSIRQDAVVRTPYPEAARALIHEADVAAVVAAVLLGDGHAGRAYDLTGPQLITQAEQVRAIGAAIGREIRCERVTRAQAREEMGHFMPLPVVDMVLDYMAESVDKPGEALPTVEQITGRPARAFATWAADHASDFTAAPLMAARST